MNARRRKSAVGSDPSESGPQAEGPHADGLRDGLWRIRHPDGSVEEGRYMHGLIHGEWVLRDPSGAVTARETWRFGRSAETGTAGREGAERPDG